MVATAPMQGPPKKVPTWIVVLIVLGGLTLLVVPVVGALAIYGVRKYIANTKTAEARNSLGQIAKDAATAYAQETTVQAGRHGRTTTGHRLCRSAGAPVPPSIAQVRGMKYQSTEADWQADRAAHAGFSCLKFWMSAPQYYQYAYTAHGAGSAGDGFVAFARGDLNGDGRASELSIAGNVDGSGNLAVAPSLKETDPEE